VMNTEYLIQGFELGNWSLGVLKLVESFKELKMILGGTRSSLEL
jgi:hypothetical protein